MAAFPVGVRHPAEGFSAHAATELSFILDGEFDVETPEGVLHVGRDSLVVIPAGEPNATLTLPAGRVVEFLAAEQQGYKAACPPRRGPDLNRTCILPGRPNHRTVTCGTEHK